MILALTVSQVAFHLLYAECQYSLGNWQVARTYYSSALQLTGGMHPRALYGIAACTASLGGQRVRIHLAALVL